VFSHAVSKLVEINFQNMKDGFVSNIIIYKNLSLCSNNYYGLGKTKVLQDPIVQNFGRKKLKDN